MALGLRTVPVVARGGDYIFGQSLRDVAGFLGIAMDGDGPLPVAALHERLQRVMAVARAIIAQYPDDKIGEALPGRNRLLPSQTDHP